MSQYFATFPAGIFDLIAKQLKGYKLDELKIVEHDDSSVLFASSLTIEKLIELRYFTNVYLVIDDQSTTSAIKGSYYRLMLLKGGEPQQMDAAQRAKLEARIQQDYQLEPNTHLSKNDFYLIERSSGKKLFTLKLSRSKREKLAAGELRPELAHILCLAAGVKAKRTVVDMFAGYGSLPFEAVRGFGCKQVIAVDNQKLPKRHEHKLIKWYENDARKLDFLADDSVDRVVTDPPWGIYDAGLDDLPSLYSDFMNELVRILKPDGVAVILSGYDKAAAYLEKNEKLRLIGRWNVLVSGKKATIYKLQKER
jgi:tRNA (guanine6-N2)-methyltransferase